MYEINYLSLEFGLALLFLLFLTFFALFESALHSLTRFDLKFLNVQHRKKRNIILYLLAHNNLQVIIPLNFGIQLSFIGIAILTTHIIFLKIKTFAILWAFVIIFIINLMFRQIIPRLLTQTSPDKKLLYLLPVFSIFFPLLRFLAYPITLTLQKVKFPKTIPEEKKSKDVVNKEIQALIAIGKEEDVLEKEEGALVESVLGFGDAKAREVMTPRSKIIALQKNATLKEIQNLMVKEKHSRIPIYHENLDQIVGVIYVRHLLKKFEEGKGNDPINNLLLPPVFVSEEKSLSELLKEMQRRRSSMVFVKNEYGGIAGLITIEDLLEEIVGEISDEDQTEEEEIIPHGRNRFLVSGNVSLDKLSETINLSLEDEDCQTIGGLVTKAMGQLPKKDDHIEISGMNITILNADSRKVNRLIVERSAPLSGDASSPEQKDTGSSPD